ncbi:PQQ-binding-like beta-propeller repeat protein [Archangium gephyra]|nr:PQQ-binding-like beta-propeller repeat protein [Archangium gephyra]
MNVSAELPTPGFTLVSAPVRHNPFVGPRAFQQGEPLFGRDREVQQLLDLLIAERIVLLFAPSGAGKTSLIQAALLPRLADEGFHPLPVVRVNLSPPAEAVKQAHDNRFVLSTLLCLEEPLPQEQRTPVERLARMTLPDWFEQRERELAQGGSPVLVFDQFEELITIDAPNREAKAEFIHQVGAVLRDHGRWALFAIREDYLGGLEPYVRAVPTRLKTTLRLDLLGEEAARLAIQEPARLEGIDFTDEAASKLLDDLRRVKVQQPDGSMEEQFGPYVEPVQIQVVCRGLWERLPQDVTRIELQDVEAVGNADEALARYYSDQVAVVATELGLGERFLRDWFEHQLILEAGIRAQVLRESKESGGLRNEVVERLVHTHLVRAESWGSRLWYELAHDRLIKPIRKDNAAWFERHLNVLQQHARWWRMKGKMPGLLLRDEALEEAESWARERPGELDVLEREYLEQCQQARAQLRKERRQRRWIGLLAIATGLTSVAALLGLVFALRSSQQIKQQVEMTTSEAFAAATYRHLERRPDLALLWPLSRLVEDDTPHLRSSLLMALRRWSQMMVYRIHGDAMVTTVAFSPDGKIFVSGGGDKRIVLWDTENGIQIDALSHESAVYRSAFSPDGKLLAVGTIDGRMTLWDLGKVGSIQHKSEWQAHDGSVTSVAFSGKGLLATGGEDGKVRLWNVDSGQSEAEPFSLDGPINSVAFSHDGRLLAVAGNEGRIRLWNVATRKPLKLSMWTSDGEPISSLGFSPTQPILAGGSSTGRVLLWDLNEGEAPWLDGKHEREVFQVVFSTDGTRLVSASADESLFIWSVQEKSREQVIPTQSSGSPTSVAFHPSGAFLAWGDDWGTVTLWDHQAQTRLMRNFRMRVDDPTLLEPEARGFFEPEGAEQIALSQDGTVLVSTSSTGVYLRDPSTLQVVGAPLPLPPETSLWGPALSPDGRILAVASGTDILLWDTTQRKSLGRLPPRHLDTVMTLAFSPDGATLASAGMDGYVILWDIEKHEPRGDPLVQPDGAKVFSLAFKPGGHTLASGDSKGRIMLWDLASRQPHLVPRQMHSGPILSLAFSPDGKKLASGGADSHVSLWELQSDKSTAFADHSDRVMAVLFSPDGRTLISAGFDRQILLTDVQLLEVNRLSKDVHTGPIYSLAFEPNRQSLLSSDENGTLIDWMLNPEDWKFMACMTAGSTLRPEDWQRVAGERPKPGVLMRACPLAAIQEAHLAELSGYHGEARERYQQLASLMDGDTDYRMLNSACWYGATDGFAQEVKPACERLVEHSPRDEQYNMHDTRGVARALTGDLPGAITDFRAFLEGARGNAVFNTLEDAGERTAKREHWIAELEAGRNPFDAATLKLLQRE